MPGSGGNFGLVGAAYRSQSVLADCQTCMNWYLEQIESGMGRNAAALYQTPGLNQLWNFQLGTGGRGITTALGRTFAVVGTQFFELYAPNISPNVKNWSTVSGINLASDGTPVSMDFGGHQLLIASAGVAYVFDLSTNTLSKVDPSAGGQLPIAQVCYIDGFFFALGENNAPTPWQINSSNALDATTWQGTNFTEVTVFPDNPNGIFRNARLLWVFGPKGIQPYSNTGDFPFPFDVIDGTFIENGLAAQNSIVRLDNSIFWLGSDERGSGVVYRANGFTPQRVSNHGVEYALQSYPTIADGYAYSYQDQGHSFYVLHLPTANKTWALDVATGEWAERGYWNTQKGSFDRSRAAFHTFNFGMHIALDYSTGVAYQMAINIYSDNGNAIRRVRRAPHVNTELEYMFHERLQLDLEVGLATFQGGGAETVITLADATGALWSVTITDQGAFVLTAGSTGNPASFYLNDPATASTWQLVPIRQDATHATLQPVAVPYVATYPSAQPMISNTGETQWLLTVKKLTPTIAQLVTTLLGIVARGPLITLKWSNDGGFTFTGGQQRDCGQAGDRLKRVMWNWLGRARDRVYEISVSDPVPWRIINAYLRATSYDPATRLTKEAAKRA